MADYNVNVIADEPIQCSPVADTDLEITPNMYEKLLSVIDTKTAEKEWTEIATLTKAKSSVTVNLNGFTELYIKTSGKMTSTSSCSLAVKTSGTSYTLLQAICSGTSARYCVAYYKDVSDCCVPIIAKYGTSLGVRNGNITANVMPDNIESIKTITLSGTTTLSYATVTIYAR